MPTITFEASDGASKKTVESPKGGAVADIIDDSNAPVPFSCRSASCATCHIEVLEGGEFLAPPEEDELDVLEALSSKPPQFRLACCAQLKAVAGVVRVRAQNEM